MSTVESIRAVPPRAAAPSLLELARNGDLAAFERLVRPHVDRLRRVLRPVAGGEDRAEDVASETLLRAFQRLDRYEDRRLGTWLQRIGINLAVSARRREALDRRAMGERLARFAPPEARDPAEEVARREEGVEMSRALGDLPDRYRRVLELRFVGELSCGEIAERLGTTANAVSLILHRARQRLRDALQAAA